MHITARIANIWLLKNWNCQGVYGRRPKGWQSKSRLSLMIFKRGIGAGTVIRRLFCMQRADILQKEIKGNIDLSGTGLDQIYSLIRDRKPECSKWTSQGRKKVYLECADDVPKMTMCAGKDAAAGLPGAVSGQNAGAKQRYLSEKRQSFQKAGQRF